MQVAGAPRQRQQRRLPEKIERGKSRHDRARRVEVGQKVSNRDRASSAQQRTPGLTERQRQAQLASGRQQQDPHRHEHPEDRPSPEKRAVEGEPGREVPGPERHKERQTTGGGIAREQQQAVL